MKRLALSPRLAPTPLAPGRLTPGRLAPGQSRYAPDRWARSARLARLARLACLGCSGLAVALVGCFDPPSLAELDPPPLADLGTADTWAPIADQGAPPGEEPDGPGGGGPGGSGSGGADADLGTSAEPLDPHITQLRLTELLPNPDGKDGGPGAPEIVEIENNGDHPVKLRGIEILARSWPNRNATDLGIDGLILGPHELLLILRWATDMDPALATVEHTANGIHVGFLHSGGLRNTDGSVELWAGDQLLDQVEYGPNTATPTPGSGRSLCRPPVDQDPWTQCDPSPGAPNPGLDGGPGGGRETPPIEPGVLIITEVMANPPGPAAEEKPWEYVEIINVSENEVELSGLWVGDKLSFDAPGKDPLTAAGGDGGCASASCLAPGARALIVAKGFLGESNDALLLETNDTGIADGGLTMREPVLLWRSDGVMISSYRVWPDPNSDPVPYVEQPLHRVELLGEDEPSNWVSAPASPGL
jgi:hypothetical protein